MQAFPDTLELRPNSSATIRLAFRPPRDGQYYVQGLLLMATLKSQRSFRLVGEGQPVVPPWCIGLLVRTTVLIITHINNLDTPARGGHPDRRPKRLIIGSHQQSLQQQMTVSK
jgi:hypothetical protein